VVVDEVRVPGAAYSRSMWVMAASGPPPMGMVKRVILICVASIVTTGDGAPSPKRQVLEAE